MQQDIYIIDDTTELLDELNQLFKDESDFHFVSTPSNNIDMVLKNIPTMIIIDDDNTNLTALEICQKIRTNEDNIIGWIF